MVPFISFSCLIALARTLVLHSVHVERADILVFITGEHSVFHLKYNVSCGFLFLGGYINILIHMYKDKVKALHCNKKLETWYIYTIHSQQGQISPWKWWKLVLRGPKLRCGLWFVNSPKLSPIQWKFYSLELFFSCRKKLN